MSPWKPLANLQDIGSFQAKEVEETIEGLLLRLEEFCSLTDMVSVWEAGIEAQARPQALPGVPWGSHLGGGGSARGRRGAAPAGGGGAGKPRPPARLPAPPQAP